MPWEETENEITHRVQDPSIFIKDSFATITLKKDHPRVDAIIAKRPGQDTTEIQALRFPKEDGWTLDAAKEWAAAHPQHSVHASDVPRFLVVLGAIPTEGLVRTALARLGHWAKGKLQFKVTLADLAAIVQNFRKRPKEIVIDYDHASLYSAGGGQPVPASGWITSIEDEPDSSGVLWGLVNWTDKARQLIAAKEYKYLSPVIDWAARDNRTGQQQGASITSAALTNQPILDMPGIALSDGWAETNRRKSMVTKLVLADRAACTARVVDEDGTERVLGIEGLAPEPKVLTLAHVKRTADGRLDFDAIPQDALVAGEVLLARRAQELLDAAVHDGRITPAQRPHFEKLALSDVAAFADLAKSLKPQIDLSERGFSGGAPEGADLAQIDTAISAAVRDRMSSAPNLTYAEAQRLVLGEQPGLRKRREELMA